MALLSGFSGQHAIRRIEAAALVPYPLAGDICINGVWVSEAQQNVRILDQAYDFSNGELTTRLVFTVEDHQAQVNVLTFCSRNQPTIVCQEITFEVDGACDVCMTAKVDLFGVEGVRFDTTEQLLARQSPPVMAVSSGRTPAVSLTVVSHMSPSCLGKGWQLPDRR